MPAAELSRLRVQINKLIARFSDPVGLRSELRDLLELYANRSYRPGQAVQVQSILPSYRVAPLIMSQLELELSKTCQEQPQAALNVVEALWQDSYLEPRLLATTLLGAIPANEGTAVAQKLSEWARPDENSRMLDALFSKGTLELRRLAPNYLLALAEKWLSSTSRETQPLGVRMLVPLIQDPTFENLPAIFRLLSPPMQVVTSEMHTDLQIAIEALVKRSPTETAFFLRQVLAMGMGPGTARLIRRCLPLFDAAEQASLRAALHAAGIR